ncbi:MAG: glycosyltransferase family 2 protein [Candidatus Bathyarchaeota archaeon]|nr:glycosyltransferase family 2 protein [Candidatus Bathyarchaeota archaeon]
MVQGYSESVSISVQASRDAVSFDEVTVVIPTLNEEKAVGKVIEELTLEGFHNILVVDGYSSDGTVEVAKVNGTQIIYQHGSGKTGALKTAIEYVQTPYLLVMDSDFTYDSRDIQRLLNHGRSYAQVIGARSRSNISLLHRFGNWVITRTFNLLFGAGISDVCSGMYLLETEVAKELELKSGGFLTEVEIASQIAAEHNVTEVPINYRQRIGQGKLTAWNGFGILFAVLRMAWKYNPVLLFSMFSALAGLPAFAILGWVAFEQLVVGFWHSGWALMSVMLLLFASQAVAVATMSILIKRTEQRISRRITQNALIER